jgi:hypothetical protein
MLVFRSFPPTCVGLTTAISSLSLQTSLLPGKETGSPNTGWLTIRRNTSAFDTAKAQVADFLPKRLETGRHLR